MGGEWQERLANVYCRSCRMPHAQFAVVMPLTIVTFDDPMPPAEAFARLCVVMCGSTAEDPIAQPSLKSSGSERSIAMQLIRTLSSTACQHISRWYRPGV